MSRPLGFLLLMIAFGLRLDSHWQVLADLLFVAGAVVSGAGLAVARSAFVPPDDGR
jgi:hypothetical protein